MLEPLRSSVVTAMALAMGIYGLGTPNPVETAWTAVMFYLLTRWFWWKNQPGIVLYMLAFPFVEIHTTVFEANQYGLSLNALFEETGKATFWYSSIGLLFVSLAFKAGIQRIKLPTHETLREAAHKISQLKLLIVYSGSVLLTILLDRLIPWGSGLHQLETYAQGISTALLVSLGIHYWITKKRPLLILALFLAVLITSFYSYFSDWRLPFTLFIVTAMSSVSRVNRRSLLRIAPILVPMLALVLLWQTIKGEYREFLSQGQRTQAVLVDRTTALNKFQELSIQALTKPELLNEDVVAQTYRRAGYLEYFSAAVKKVPSEIPHENGSLLAESLSYSLARRILNPDKGSKNDRAKVERYTDYYFGTNSFSSFSLGHYCEAYIDWGGLGMMIHLFVYGLIGAGLVLLTLKRSIKINPVITAGILWVVLTPWGTFQQDMVTVSGQVFWGTLCHLFLFTWFYRFIHRYVQVPEANTPRQH